MRYFICISFRGARYSGWQIQKNANSIEEEVERALSILLGEKTDIVGAGRTDSGVNAINYIAHFDLADEKLLKEPKKGIYKLNAILPSDIVVNDIFRVPDNAHARFDALWRTYCYYVTTVKDPFSLEFFHFCKYELDVAAMNKGASYLIGTKDFSCFEKLHGGNATSICEVREALWKPISPSPTILPRTPIVEHPQCCTGEAKEGHILFTITANRFLRNMVRSIVGSLIEIGRGKREPEWVLELLASKNRCAAGESVPGNALFLTKIEYCEN